VKQEEIQRIKCAQQYGAGPAQLLQFGYLNRKSPPIAGTASASDVKQAVEALPGILNAGISVAVSFSRGPAVCSPAGELPVETTVHFSTRNDIQQLKVISLDSSQLLVSGEAEVVEHGDLENAVCNNKGHCNEAQGICECFSGWGSSDGDGNAGGTGDCGYRLSDPVANQGYATRTSLRLRINRDVDAALAESIHA
jgi:hypothetical protein